MKLRVWLDIEGMLATDLAKKLDVTDGAITLWCQGVRVPRPALMRKIVKVTKGKVTPQDFY
jgi:DNA-binding transcriptional regulator YdaS (Cro superfamily)